MFCGRRVCSKVYGRERDHQVEGRHVSRLEKIECEMDTTWNSDNATPSSGYQKKQSLSLMRYKKAKVFISNHHDTIPFLVLFLGLFSQTCMFWHLRAVQYHYLNKVFPQEILGIVPFALRVKNLLR